eukprot:TRINITY_DN2592_c0_g1_i7.p1 TRINITY_DN2592_c0_g1~~TRINITY_DN2592_c0_g1_i7.p1  ORF type:complete len:135 (+),score=30.24 TRINITY_DN2592_c0_g1_i7:350-754(+)
MGMAKHKAEKDHELAQKEQANQCEVKVKQQELAQLLDSLTKLKEEQSEQCKSLTLFKDRARQLEGEIHRHKVTKVESDLRLSENLSDPRSYVEAAQDFTVREVRWVAAQIGGILECRRAEGYYTPVNTYNQYKN